jgi:hypothetical protein
MSECFFDGDGNLNSSPRPEAIKKLRDILKGWEMGKEDLVWGPAPDLSNQRIQEDKIYKKEYEKYRPDFYTGHVCQPGCEGGIGPCRKENKKEGEDE